MNSHNQDNPDDAMDEDLARLEAELRQLRPSTRLSAEPLMFRLGQEAGRAECAQPTATVRLSTSVGSSIASALTASALTFLVLIPWLRANPAEQGWGPGQDNATFVRTHEEANRETDSQLVKQSIPHDASSQPDRQITSKLASGSAPTERLRPTSFRAAQQSHFAVLLMNGGLDPSLITSQPKPAVSDSPQASSAGDYLRQRAELLKGTDGA